MMRHLLTTILAVLLVAAGFHCFTAADQPAAVQANPGPQATDENQIAALIEQLDSNRYREREAATQALLEAGDATLDPLVAAANGDRPEAADRAVWILKKMGNSSDHAFALAALDRLVKVKERPAVVAQARRIQGRLREQVCQQQLAKLGGTLAIVDSVQPVVGPIVRVELGDEWRGNVDDLKCLLELDQRHYFQLVGPGVDDEVIKLFETKDGLRLLRVFMSRVTPAAADSLKAHQPKATVYIRNRALLGIGGDSQANGVRVVKADQQYGAAEAGIVVGDVITMIDGTPIKDFDRLTAVIAQYQPGDEVEVVVLRGEKTLTTRVTLSDRPPEL